MTVVVTGATGKLGHRIVEHLLERGVDAASIVATGRDGAALEALAARGVVAVASDYDDRASLDAVFAGADTVMFVASPTVGSRIPQHTNVVEAARAVGVRWVVYTSSPGALTSPFVLNPEHKFTEELLDASGLTTTVLRNGWYTENFLPDVQRADRMNELLNGWGDGRVAAASRLDLAEAAAVVLTTEGHAGRTYTLTGSTAVSGDDLAAAVGAVVGHFVTYSRRTEDEQEIDLQQAGLDDNRARFLIEIDRGIRDGFLAEVHPDLERLLGRPPVPLAQALRIALETEPLPPLQGTTGTA